MKKRHLMLVNPVYLSSFFYTNKPRVEFNLNLFN